jgi:hypothetical protein
MEGRGMEATDRERMLGQVEGLTEAARGLLVGLEELRTEIAGDADREPPAVLCRMLADAIAGYARRPRVTATWEAEARRLLERDGVTFEQAAAVLGWLTTYEGREATFWRRNVLSMPTFRSKWDRLVLAMRQDAEAARSRGNGRAGRLLELARSLPTGGRR